MSKRLSIHRGRIRFWFCGGYIRTHRRRNPSLKLGPRRWSKTSIRARKHFFNSFRRNEENSKNA